MSQSEGAMLTAWAIDEGAAPKAQLALPGLVDVTVAEWVWTE